MNLLIVANKPANISSNHFLSILKRKYGEKKAGFSGTLDPFASGTLIVGFGSYTRLFRFLKKSPKVYEATMWLGANSKSLDNENIDKIDILLPFHIDTIEYIRRQLLGKIEYTPPKFSAKHINGKRAYKLVRADIDFNMPTSSMEIFDCKILSYMHPFLSFRISLSEGGYVRSYAELFAKRLGVCATVSSLKRISEGSFKFENERPLKVPECLGLLDNEYFGNYADIYFGKKLSIDNFKYKSNGIYLLNFENFFSIIEIKDNSIAYLLNKVEKC